MVLGMLGVFGIFGIFAGSFLNLLIDRFYRGEQILIGRSHCDNCKHTLSWKDLIPLLSFVLLGGKCRYCDKPIGWINPSVELVTGVSFGLIAGFSDLSNLSSLSVLGYLSILSLAGVFIITFFADIKYGVVYQEVIVVGILAVLVYWITGEIGGTREIRGIICNLIAASCAFLFFWILHKAFKGRAMGRGDADLAFLVGLTAGWPNVIVALFFSFLTGAVFGLILVVTGAQKLKSTVPFGPFLIAGLVISLIFGESFINWYFGLL